MRKNGILISIVLILAALLSGALFLTSNVETPVEHAGSTQNAPVDPVSLTYQGTEYPLKKNIQTVLLIGTDSDEAYQQEEKLQDFYNFHQADVLFLLVLDKDANTAEIIQINRDTMTDVPWLDVLGNYGGTEFKQICLAYNYGDGGAKSCKNTLSAVSALLFDAPIDHYIQLPMSAIAILNDLVGGVPVTLDEDMTAIDPAFIQGSAIRLNGAQAEKYLRARMALKDDTNLSRMRRQRIYLDSFRMCAAEMINTDSAFLMKMLETLAEYLQSDMTAQQLSDLIKQLDTMIVSPIRFPEGKLIRGTTYYEFYVDKASLWNLAAHAYCE